PLVPVRILSLWQPGGAGIPAACSGRDHRRPGPCTDAPGDPGRLGSPRRFGSGRSGRRAVDQHAEARGRVRSHHPGRPAGACRGADSPAGRARGRTDHRRRTQTPRAVPHPDGRRGTGGVGTVRGGAASPGPDGRVRRRSVMIDNLVMGLEAALSLENLLWCFIGVLARTVIGILAGLGSATGVAILIPLTLTLDPITALIMLAGIYHGSQYGATITAILIATPGEASSVVTTLDGYQMARNGRAGQALAISAISAFTASIVSVLLLFTLAQFFADIAVGFGPVEIMAIMLLGFA